MKGYTDTFNAPPTEQMDPGEAMRPTEVAPTPSGWGSYGDMWRQERPTTGNWLDDYMASKDLQKQPTAQPESAPAQVNTVVASWKAPNPYEGESGVHVNKTPEGDFAKMESEADAKYKQARAAQPKKEEKPEEHFAYTPRVDPSQPIAQTATPTVTVPEAQRFRTADDGSVFFRGADGEYQVDPRNPVVQRSMAQASPAPAPRGDLWGAAARRG